MEHTNLDEFLAATPPKKRFQSLTEHFFNDATQKREIVESRHKEEKAEEAVKKPHREKKIDSLLPDYGSGLVCEIRFEIMDSIIKEDNATLRLVLLLYRKKTELNSDTFSIPKKDRESYGLDRSSVSRSLAKLKALGLVQVFKAPGSSSVVTLIGF